MNVKKYIVVIVLLSIINYSYAQTKSEIKEIIKNYDIEKINAFTKKAKQISVAQKKEALRLAKINNWPIIIDEDDSYSELMRVINGKPIYNTTTNKNAAKSTRTNTLHNGGLLGLNLEGQNMTVYVWDAGIALATHQEYDGVGGDDRFTAGETSATHDHSAHVTGTIIASGVSSNAKGMAPQASAIGYDWNNDMSEVSEATSNGMLLSNHSYGFNPDATYEDWWFGAYGEDAESVDIIMYNAPYYLLVSSAGNDGEQFYNGSPLNGNVAYDKLTKMSTSKNSLIVANAEDANIDANGNLLSVAINTSSTQGPTDDLRVKPDITGNGTLVYSTTNESDVSYGVKTGTSMSSPNVTGTLLLLQQHYNNTNGVYMKSSMLKGLALHTADDLYGPGPDAEFGWGLMNAKKAAEVISGNGLTSLIRDIALNQGESYTIDVISDDVSSLLASISWTDPPGSRNEGSLNLTTPVLVNDLDIRVTNNTETFLPYRLASVSSNELGDNIVDPYERIDIEDASGNYTITITHKGSLLSGQQNVSLIVSGLEFECTAPVPANVTASMNVFSTTVSWDAINTVTYEVRYRENGTTTWTVLNTANTSLEFSGLDITKYYEIQVRSVCPGETAISNYSNSVYVGTTAGLNDYIASFIAYPNPIESLFTIKGIDTISNISVYNLLGELVLESTPNNKNSILDMKDLNSGTYFIKVTINESSETMRVFKK